MRTDATIEVVVPRDSQLIARRFWMMQPFPCSLPNKATQLGEAVRIGINGRCSADASRRVDTRAKTCRQDVPGHAAVGAEHLQLL
jgi:hypothetical protein